MESLHSLINLEKGKKELICIIGAGGKTSVLFQLARELSAIGMRVLVTTTTAIYYPEAGQYDEILVSTEESPELFEGRSNCGITVLGSSVSAERKLLGVSPDFLDAVFLKGIFDYIIVEGDGSKGRPIKAPAEHEPVIPSGTSKLLGIVGMDCVGKRVSKEYVHRPELFCKVTECREQDIINTAMVCRLVTGEKGLFKNAPAACEKYLVLNKAEEGERKAAALDIANRLSGKGSLLSGIIITSFKASSFQRVGAGISGIILAAGLSRRMGTDKLLLEIGGIPVIERTIRAAVQSGLSELLLVCSSDTVAAIGNKYRLRVIENNAPQEGQSRSVRLGVENAFRHSAGFMFLVGDQPYTSTEVIDRLIEEFKSGDYNAAVPVYNGKRGNPVIFSHSLRKKLMGLSGDSGGRILLEGLEESIATVKFEDELSGFDIDTREEYEMLLKLEDKNG